MIEFHFAALADKPRIDALLRRCGERGCEYTFTNLFAWSGPYQLQVAEVEGSYTGHFVKRMLEADRQLASR